MKFGIMYDFITRTVFDFDISQKNCSKVHVPCSPSNSLGKDVTEDTTWRQLLQSSQAQIWHPYHDCTGLYNKATSKSYTNGLTSRSLQQNTRRSHQQISKCTSFISNPLSCNQPIFVCCSASYHVTVASTSRRSASWVPGLS